MKRIIYGAGNYGKLLFAFFQNWDINIDYFAQTNAPTDDYINGIEIISFEQILNIQEEMKIMISIKDPKMSREIKQMFWKTKRKDIEVYDMSGFIGTNLVHRVRFNLIDGRYYCMICNNNLNSFESAGIKSEIFNKYHIIGGGYREHCICPFCGSGDRERWLYYVIKNKTNIESLKGRVLHFAPEIWISKLIQWNNDIDYYTGDIAPGLAMHVTDITDIQYKDETFDYVICNHVMEHILEEEKAVSEIKRVLKPSGRWIFSFPICKDIETYEDSTIVNPEDRLNKFGQEDHVRLYGRDYRERFEKYGLQIKEYSPKDEFEKEDIEKYGFIQDDVIMIANKI